MEIQLWREILTPYDLAVKELIVKFEHLIYEHRSRGMYSPVEQVSGRVKTVASILDKAQKKNIAVDEIEEKLMDIAGVRIICQFVEDIQKVVEIIRRRTDMEVIAERDYINHMKDSGYRSYHMILSVEAPYEDVRGDNPGHFFVEIQLRTIAMDSWASLEHEMKYKHHIRNAPLIEQELKRCADELASCDISMQTIRKLIREEGGTE